MRHDHEQDLTDTSDATVIEATKRAKPAAHDQNAQLEKNVGTKRFQKDSGIRIVAAPSVGTQENGTANGNTHQSSFPPSKQTSTEELYEKSRPSEISPNGNSQLTKSAYETAWDQLNDNDRMLLSEGTPIRTLFQQLDETDENHQAETWLQRGRMKVGVEYLQQACEYLDLFTSIIPAPGMDAALGLIKGTFTFVVTLCGRYDDLTGHIKELCDRVPALDRCSSVVSSNHGSADIFNGLVDAYSVLLRFYIKVTRLLAEASRLDKFWESFRTEIPRMVGDFGTITQNLDHLINAEQFASTMEIRQTQLQIWDKLLDEEKKMLDQFIRTNMQAYCRTGSGEQVRKGSSKACEWILDKPEFRKWQDSPVGTVLTMFGNMGCGKTAVTSYLERLVKANLPGPNPPTAVLSFQCRAQEAMPLYDVYKGLIYQLVMSRPWLKAEFKKWHEKADSNPDGEDVFKKASLLGEFLQEKIEQSADWTTIFLDGLDEMDEESRQDLLELIRTLLCDNARLKVFLASQHRDDIEETLQSFQASSKTRQYSFTVDYIEMRPTLDRDRALAEHLVFAIRWRPARGDSLKREVVEQIAKRADGSAIWLQMATTALKFNLTSIIDDEAVDRFMEWLKTEPSLIQLYSRLFESRVPASETSEMGRKAAEAALESLTVARRPLSIGELTFAVFLDQPHINGLEKLNGCLGSLDTVMDYIRPFVSVNETTGRYSLVHQSLVELVLKRPPTQWQSLVKKTAGNPSDIQELKHRRGGLHAAMLSRCTKYIMFDEFQEKDLAAQLREPEAKDKALEFLHNFQPFDESDAVEDSDSKEDADKYIPLEFDPEKCGFGKFFAYAAAYWLDHFAEIPPDMQDLKPKASTIVQLCGYGTKRLENWAEVWKKPSCRFADERPHVQIKELDPLAVMAYVDPSPVTLGTIAQEKQNSPESFSEFSERNMVKILMEEWIQQPEMIQRIIDDPMIGYAICDPTILSRLLVHLGPMNSRDLVDWPGPQWNGIFKSLIEKLGPKLTPYAHYTLRKACQSGCLALVEFLFEAGEKWPELRAAMLSDRRPDEEEGSYSNDYIHQSVGEAVYRGHIEVVRFLCQQEGIEPHLKYVTLNGYTIFHYIDRNPQSQILEILIPLWPQGVHTKDADGHIPLYWLLKGNEFPAEDSIDTVALETLLRLGKYTPQELDGEPMELATSKASPTACRMLVKYGATAQKLSK